MVELTERQREVLEFVVRCIRGVLRYPTYQEIGEELGIVSKQAVSDHIVALERKGYVSRVGTPKSMQLTSKTRREYGLYFTERKTR